MEWKQTVGYIRALLTHSAHVASVKVDHGTEVHPGNSPDALFTGDSVEDVVVARVPKYIQSMRDCPADFPPQLQAAWKAGDDIAAIQLPKRDDPEYETEERERERDVDAPDETVASAWEHFTLCEGARGLDAFPRFGRVMIMRAIHEETGAAHQVVSDVTNTNTCTTGVAPGDRVPADAGTGCVYIPGTITGGLHPAVLSTTHVDLPAIRPKRPTNDQA